MLIASVWWDTELTDFSSLEVHASKGDRKIGTAYSDVPEAAGAGAASTLAQS